MFVSISSNMGVKVDMLTMSIDYRYNRNRLSASPLLFFWGPLIGLRAIAAPLIWQPPQLGLHMQSLSQQPKNHNLTPELHQSNKMRTPNPRHAYQSLILGKIKEDIRIKNYD